MHTAPNAIIPVGQGASAAGAVSGVGGEEGAALDRRSGASRHPTTLLTTRRPNATRRMPWVRDDRVARVKRAISRFALSLAPAGSSLASGLFAARVVTTVAALPPRRAA